MNHLFLIAGPCAIEDEQMPRLIAKKVKDLADQLEIPFVFKASYRKANRTRLDSFVGLPRTVALEILRSIKEEFDVPVLTDVHESWHATLLPDVDVLQIPAFLCRQTDLILSCAMTGKPTNIKKGQHTSPESMQWAVEKHGGPVMLTERGTFFGYGNLVVDMIGLIEMRKYAPVIFDATHSVQHAADNRGKTTGGKREFAPVLARAALAVGVDGVFMEVHDDPDNAPSDGPNMIRLQDLRGILETLLEFATVAQKVEHLTCNEDVPGSIPGGGSI